MIYLDSTGLIRRRSNAPDRPQTQTAMKPQPLTETPVCPVCKGLRWIVTARDMASVYGDDHPVLIDYASACPGCTGQAKRKGRAGRSLKT